MIEFRKKHPAVRRELPKAACGFPGISFHTERAWDGALTSDTRAFGVLYAGRDEEKNRDDLVYLAINPWWEGIRVALPGLPEEKSWSLKVCTCDGPTGAIYPRGKEARGDSLYLGPRSVLVLEA